MNDNKQAAEGPGPDDKQGNIPAGAQSTAKPGSLGDKPDTDMIFSKKDFEKLTKANRNLIDANDRLVDERDKLSKKVAKLETRVENQTTALKGKATEIANLKKTGGAKKMNLQEH